MVKVKVLVQLKLNGKVNDDVKVKAKV